MDSKPNTQVVEPEQQNFVLILSCKEARGIVRAVSDFLYQQGATIYEAAEHRDRLQDQFFMRVEFEMSASRLPGVETLRQSFSSVATGFGMSWDMWAQRDKPRVLVAVSRHGHCLNDLLHKWDSGVLPAEIVGVVSNHPEMQQMSEWYGLPYHHLPVSADNRSEQEARILQLMEEQSVDLLALARYMQILTPEFCEALPGRIINIHHSFLPGFKGADPYAQAYERGVKIIGATAHYVTAELDE